MADVQLQQKPLPGGRMPRADFLTSIVLLAFSVGVVALSIRMPRLEHRNINPYTIPGLVPGLLGVAIGIMSVMLLVRSLRYRGHRLGIDRAALQSAMSNPQVSRVLVTAGLCLLYAIGLVGTVWYPAATFLFVLGFILVYEYETARPLREQLGRIRFAFVEALLTATLVSVVFRYLFLVRLP